MAKKSKSKTGDDEEGSSSFNPYTHLDDTLDSIEKDFSLSGSGLSRDERRMNTVSLAIDLVLGGGITAGGWYTFVGGEQSSKSTLANSTMAMAVNSSIPIVSMWDYEGSTDAEYLANILKSNRIDANVEDVFGIRDPKTGKWLVKPRVRYYSETVAEKFFDYLAKLERLLPDVRKIGDDWFYIYENTKPNKSIVGSKYDKSYFSKTGKFRVPAPNGNLQALVICDSYPAMLPEKMDTDDPSNAMAMQARMFSEQMKRVKGRMKAKRIAVIGINQLRQKPAVMFGSPEYEPGGEALKFYSDCRIRLASRALSAVVNGGKGYEETEDSYNGEGEDTYRYVHARAIKNKLSVPNLECFLRIWITDADGAAMGIDPVFDTFQYLEMTGQISGPRKKMVLKLRKHDEVTLDWGQLKTLVLGSRKEVAKVCDKIGLEKMFIREFCRKQLNKGVGIDLFFENKKNAKLASKAKNKAAESDDDDEDEDED